LRIVLFGSTEFSVPTLAAVAKLHEVVLVVTTPPKPAGRGLALAENPVLDACDDLGIECISPASVRKQLFLEIIAALSPDALVLAAYGKIIPPDVLALTPWPVCLHPSLLPRLRGPSPIRTALMNGDMVTGVTTFVMVEAVDAGPVIMQEECAIDEDDNYETLHARLAAEGALLVTLTLEKIAEGAAEPKPQDDGQATFTKIIERDDTHIDFAKPVRAVRCLIRACDPDLGAFAAFRGRRLKIYRASDSPRPSSAAPGTITYVGKASLDAACADGAIEVLEVQPQDRARMPAQAFIAGHRPQVGEILA
jgi:methionyl-tRNA formyltransferase